MEPQGEERGHRQMGQSGIAMVSSCRCRSSLVVHSMQVVAF